ncbi:hypothetical protein [Streptomyces sp. NBC_01530]|uniref:hypothetical protein n=1 Tax=Streptomyces sp. NBC_01530 TaxID=2903895 RepID=UPI003867CBEC
MNEPNPVLAQKRQHVLSGMGTGGRPLAPGELVQHHGAGRIDSVGSRSSSIFTKYAVESTPQRHATRQGVPTPIA